jgi:hypothetical protein
MGLKKDHETWYRIRITEVGTDKNPKDTVFVIYYRTR